MLLNKFVLTAVLVASTLVTPGLEVRPVIAHHGWSEYNNQQTLNLTGVIRSINYANPHVVIQVETSDKKVWQAILAPPSRMQSRGLPQKDLAVGGQVKLVGYPHRSQANEIRAERIIIGDRTVELR
ncbi:DUF6152 family protein [Chroococcus sp. FPU101]|uniref:DUF6152 family protein n=1 Tax=Chroococcus sp. FPU101 TaxID=1974212 RepID=UPI001A8F137B|nr:DUF6152 family protein [Chroococcus sp. FPU101]GFE71904.1 hypothetical protein CFPU101_45140 [Chroococcus sp. FPU101]